MVKKLLLAAAATAFIFSGTSVIQPSSADAHWWGKDKAYASKKAGWDDYWAKKKKWWHDAWLGWDKKKKK